VPILRIPNVLRDELDLSDLKWVQLSEADQDKYTLRTGDILIVRTNGNPEYVGRCLVVPHLAEKMVFASYLIRLVVDPDQARPEYVVSLLNSPPIRRKLRGSVRSSAGNFNINTQGIRGVVLPVPDLAEQDRLVRQIMEFSAVCVRCQERYRAMGDIQQSITEGFAS
jgi:restriction endonuclease S subunit